MSKIDERRAEDAAVNTPGETLDGTGGDARRSVEGVRDAGSEDGREALAPDGQRPVETVEPAVGPDDTDLDEARASLDNG